MNSVVVAFLVADVASVIWGQSPKQDTAALFLDMSKINLGTVSTEEDKKNYLFTLQREKMRIVHRTLKGVYENAHDLYRAGDFEGARDLTTKILAIDPTFKDALILQRASSELRDSSRPLFSSKKLTEDRFEEGMALYRQGRLVEAASLWEEVTKLSPTNLKARYWLKKVRGELALEHYRRGQLAYEQRRLKDALDEWYHALILNPRLSGLSSELSKLEVEYREEVANVRLQTALDLYSRGRPSESLKALDLVLQVSPGDLKAQTLIREIRGEIAQSHVAAGRRLYARRKYTEAIAEWKKAVGYGYDLRQADRLIVQANDQIRLEAEAKKRAEDEAIAAAKAAADKAAADKAAADKAASESKDKPPSAEPAAPKMADRKGADQAYRNGLICWEKQDVDCAKREWEKAKLLDPGHPNVGPALERLESNLGS